MPQAPPAETPPAEVPTPPGEAAPEPTLPEGADLDELYDDAGQALYEMTDPATGVAFACDADGNPIPATRPGTPSPTPAPAAEPPAPQTPAPTPREYRAPLAQSVLTEQEQAARRQAYEDGDIDNQIAWADVVAQRTADATIVAREQQRHAARQVGIPDDLVDLGAQYQSQLPAHLRGTPQGAMAAAALAIFAEASESGDFMGTLAKYAGARTPAGPDGGPPPPRRHPEPPPPLIPPSAREVVPNAMPVEITRTTIRRGGNSVVNNLFRGQGVDVDVEALFERERGRDGR